MPSNAMSMSQHIALCQKLLAEHGDCDVVLAVPGDSKLVSVDGSNMSVAIDLPWQRLNAPVFVIGLTIDQAGRTTRLPGQLYVSEHAAGEWNNSRDSAPVGVDLDVWKRFGGRDRGFRNEAGDWFVYENGAAKRPVQIVPAGILQWKLPE